jgi:phosphopantothenoylcysteine decarboxylase/phosphopantothenate--cysteine ligase
LSLTENPDILKTLSGIKNRPQLVIGFAAETHDVVKFAKSKLSRKGCDWIVANDVSGDVMGGDHNAMTLVTKDGATDWPRMSKHAAAKKLAAAIAKEMT